MKSKVVWNSKSQYFKILYALRGRKIVETDGLMEIFKSETDLRKACSRYRRKYGFTGFKVKKYESGVVKFAN